MTETLARAAEAYVQRLGFELVIANSEKVPLKGFFRHGAKSATKNVDKLRGAIAATPGATLAARVGRRLVLDVDVRHGGIESLAFLEKTMGALPKTWTQATPTGGLHIWFSEAPGRNIKGTLAKGIETLTGNRLITLSPSERAGGRYRWLNHPLSSPLADTPGWIEREIELQPPPPRPPSTEDPVVRERRARAYLDQMDGAVAGDNGHRKTIYTAVVVVRGFDLDEHTAFQLLSEWNHRCDPPWSEFELKRKIKEAVRHGRMPWGAMLERRAA